MHKLFLFFLIILVSFISCQNDIYNRKYLVYTTTKLYTEKTGLSDEVVKINCSTVVSIEKVDDEEEWYYVKDEYGNEGWILYVFLKEYSDELYEELLAKLEREMNQKEIVIEKSPEEIMLENKEYFITYGHEVLLCNSFEEIYLKLGNPINETITYKANQYDNTVMDEIYVLEFDGMILKLYYAVSSNKIIFEEMTILSSNYSVYLDLNVGQDLSFIVKKLGEPDLVEEGSYRYNHPGFFSFVIFKFDVNDKKITEIYWDLTGGYKG